MTTKPKKGEPPKQDNEDYEPLSTEALRALEDRLTYHEGDLVFLGGPRDKEDEEDEGDEDEDEDEEE